MPFDGTDGQNSTAELIGHVLTYYADDAHWVQGTRHDGAGGRCLLGAMQHMRRVHRIEGDHMVRQMRFAIQRAGRPYHGLMVRIPTQTSRRFRSIPAGDSDGSQPLIPTYSSHP